MIEKLRSSRLTFIPLAWASQYDEWGIGPLIHVFCLLAIIPLDKLLYWNGEQMTMYLWKDLNNLVMVTLNNAVAATLAIVLLFECEFKPLRPTITGERSALPATGPVLHNEPIYPGVG
ncbi:hypothetical protein EDB84DRAFT_1462579 [Lactarius hengduanensis]|nr:hypothetical protein EDB84DRAFT_1462579 [Lactarius hengduanensis]